MDEGGESSSSHNFSPNAVGPVTPDKMGRADPNVICKNWLENPFEEAVLEQTSGLNSFSCWDGGFGSTSQGYGITGGMCGKFSMDDVDIWSSISCRDLLALADATIRKGSDYGGGGSGWMNLCDLNSLPPQTVAEPLISTGLSLGFTPLTPNQTTMASGMVMRNADERVHLAADQDGTTLVEADQGSEKGLAEQTNLNETPQPKQKRRKHRPKVVTEGTPKRARKPATPKPATPKPDGSSTGKRKYVRRKGVEKSTATPAVEETSGIMHPSPDQETKKTCKRKIDFDESEKQAEVTVDKICTMTSEVENYQKVHETECPSLITPSKTELPQGRLKRNYTKAKCKIDFLQETHDEGPSHFASPNDPNCSTSVYNKKKSKASDMSKDRYMQTCGQNSKRNKIMVPSLYHYQLGYPSLRYESIYDIDALISLFERLHIYSDAVVPYMSGYHEKNALVVYQQDRSLVPYEGDRRFSQWKGSVLDSVVGVFLTQNVSDHLSSSAFMSLAARYPAKLNASSESHHEEESIMLVKEPYQVDESGDHGSMMLQEADSCEEKEVVGSNEFSKSCVSVDLNDNSECEVAELSEKESAIYKESVINHIEVDEIVSSQNSADTCSMHKSEEQKDKCKVTIGEYTSFEELLHTHGPTRVYESEVTQKNSEKCASEDSGISAESASQTTVRMVNTISSQESANSNCMVQQATKITNISTENSEANENYNIVEASGETVQKVVDFHLNKNGSKQKINGNNEGGSKVKKEKTGKAQIKVDWDKLRMQAEFEQKRERTANTEDSMDYEAIKRADVNDVADAIKERGMNNRLAARIKDMLDRLVKDHGSMDLEWLRDVPPDKAKEYLLSFKGLGLKSVECIRLLTLHHLAFPVDTNVGRIAIRLGWVPLQPLPESLQLHLLELYPIQDTIQKYLWPRLCKLDQRTLYELHYQMITFGKVFCTKTKPNCNACPLRGECRHFASAFASARLALPAPEESIAGLTGNRTGQNPIGMIDLPSASEQPKQLSEVQNCNPVIEEPATPWPKVEVPATAGPIVEVPATPEPIIEVPASPEPEQGQEVFDIEDYSGDTEEIPMIKLNIEQFTQNLQTYMESHMELGEGDMSKALVALTSEVASIPTPKLKNVSQLRTEHQVYELPDSHPLLEGLDTREHDDPCPYLLAIWTPGETANSIQPPEGQCCSQESGTLCNEQTCFFCNSTREANSQTVRGTLLVSNHVPDM
ncbi:hypothetical protein M8C21_023453 [Ambrosia artemisiifolia]|uniref:HhH-GPD domain-containing protein n=1 Tax=Ambrosia artemisiifolia TaxID=4212 RepID=A0AAD5D3F5_AMBAR|nr:hypothetical protein M8C21_023453 [Ambrosia artemisiifolia]